MTKSALLGGSHSPRPWETGRKGASVCITGNTLTCILHHLYHKLTPTYTIYEHSHTIYTIHMTIPHLSHTIHISSHLTPLPPWWGLLSQPKARGGWGLDKLAQAGSQGAEVVLAAESFPTPQGAAQTSPHSLIPEDPTRRLQVCPQGLGFSVIVQATLPQRAGGGAASHVADPHRMTREDRQRHPSNGVSRPPG